MALRNSSIEEAQSSLVRFRIDPLTRTASRLAVDAQIDFSERRIASIRVERRPVWQEDRPERVALGYPPSDAVPLLSRCRGNASASHAIASAMALEMACQVAPPPLAVATRGLGSAAEIIAAQTRQLFLSAGPDYSEAAISRTSMRLWRKAQQARAAGQIFHGHRTIAEIMRGMNPLHGHLSREAVHLTRVACEVATLIFGKYPHPGNIFPGGIGTVADRETFQHVLARINRLLDYAKKVTAIWDDLADFFYDGNENFATIGESQANFISVGLWDDPEACDGSYAKSPVWGARRYSTPGIVIDRRLRTVRLSDINAGLEIAPVSESRSGRLQSFGAGARWRPVERAAATPLRQRDALGASLSDDHPWNTPLPADPLPDVLRWRRESLESGALARLSISTLGGKLRNEFIETVDHDDETGLMFDIPKFHLPGTILKWRLPHMPNAIERNRARAYSIAYAGMIALTYLLKAFESLERGEKSMSRRFRLPSDVVGAGFWEEGNGSVIHHISMASGSLVNYRVGSPDAWWAAAGDVEAENDPDQVRNGRIGALERALLNTPLVEEFAKPEDFTGIDIMRVVRSFDA